MYRQNNLHALQLPRYLSNMHRHTKHTHLCHELRAIQAGVVGDDGGQLAQGAREGLHRQRRLARSAGDLPVISDGV